MSDPAKSILGMLPQFGILAVVLAIAASVFTSKPGKPTGALTGIESKDAGLPTDVPPQSDRPANLLDKLVEFGIVNRLLQATWARPEVDFVILTLPDPVDTQFGTRFDEMIDVTTRAMADVYEKDNGNFVLERYWYPWQTGGKKLTPGENRPHQLHPGLIVFRGSTNPDRKKVVLLVGENPLNGVHPNAMREALAVAALRPGNEIRIVGPTFTGTQPSLNQAIREWRQFDAPGRQRPVSVVSGVALGLTSTEELSKSKGEGVANVRYRVTRVPSAILNRAIMRYLVAPGETQPGELSNALLERPAEPKRPGDAPSADHSRHHPPSSRVAYLIESSSGHGSASAAVVKDEDFNPWVLRFPMHISRLAGIQTQAAREREEQLGLTPPGALQLKRLDEARRGEDLLPPADEQRTALINKRLFQEFWETLRRERVRYVGVLASDVRDKIFLIEQLRKECPNAIVFVHGSDLQLAHPEYLSATRGTLIVTTYPLYPAAQQWAKSVPNDVRRMPFASDAGEGTYNAMLIQCGAPEDRLLDYRAPALADQQANRGSRRPAIWISTVGEDGSLMPLAYFTIEPPSPGIEDPLLIMHAVQASGESTPIGSPPQTAPLRFLIYAILMAAGFGGAWVVRSFVARSAGVNRCVVRRLKYQYASILGYGMLFATIPLAIFFLLRWRHSGSPADTESRLFDGFLFGCIFVAGFVFLAVGIASLVVQLGWSLARTDPFETWAGWMRVRWARWARRSASLVKSRRPSAIPWGLLPFGTRIIFSLPKLIHLIVSVLALVFLGWVVWDAFIRVDSGKALLFVERSANLAAGASPVLVSVFIAAGLFGYGAASLRLLAQQTEPRLGVPVPFRREERTSPTHVFTDILNRVRRQGRTLHRGGLSLWPLLWQRRITVFIAFAVAVLILVVPALLRAHPTWEGTAWTWAFAAGILTLFVLAFLSTVRLYSYWMELERLLRLVARVPMVCAFDRLPDQMRRVFRRHLFGYHRRGYDVLIPHQVLAQTAAELQRAPAPGSPAGLGDLLNQGMGNFQLGPDVAEPGDWAGVPARQFSATSRTLVCALLPCWVGRPLPEAFGARIDPNAQDEVLTGWQSLAEQFVAIQLVVFLGQFFRRLRTMALLAILPAGALIMAVTSYPFIPERLIMFSAIGVVATVLAVLFWVLYRINKNGIVSRVLKTTPDKFTPDASFLYNFVLYIVPLVLLVIVQVGGRWRTVVEPVLDLIR